MKVAVALASSFLATSVARAGTDAPVALVAPVAPAHGELEVGVIAGNGPAGALAGSVQYAPVPWLAVEAAVGHDLWVPEGSHTGTQSALTVRVRSQSSWVRAFAGVGESFGYEQIAYDADAGSGSGHPDSGDVARGTAVWTNLEVGLELDLDDSFVRMYGGAGIVDNPGTICVEPEIAGQSCRVAGYFAIAVGARLGL